MKISVDKFFREQLVTSPTMNVREPQIIMAQEVQKALRNGKKFSCEAEVGTGKSFAYLVPGVEHIKNLEKPLIISTNTIILQNQLVNKDIGDLSKILIKFGYLTEPLQSYVAKGKENYYCPKRCNQCLEKSLRAWVKTEIETAATNLETSELNNMLSLSLDKGILDDESIASLLWEGFEFLKKDLNMMLKEGVLTGIYSPELLRQYIYGVDITSEEAFDYLWEVVEKNDHIFRRLLVEGLINGLYTKPIKMMLHKCLQNKALSIKRLSSVMAKIITSAEYDLNEISDLTTELIRLQDLYKQGLFDHDDLNVNNNIWDQVKVLSCNSKCNEANCLYRIKKNQRRFTNTYDILVCNHHYLLSWVKDTKFSINKYSGIIIDEAHNLESAAYEIFGMEYSRKNFNKFISRIADKIQANGLNANPSYTICQNTVDNLYYEIKSSSIIPNEPEPETRYKVDINDAIIEIVYDLRTSLQALYKDYEISRGGLRDLREDPLEEPYIALKDSLAEIEYNSDDNIFWVEFNRYDQEYVMKTIPRNIDELLRKNLLHDSIPVILTSATLSTDTSEYGFDYFEFTTGVSDIRGGQYQSPISLKSPFDYSNQAGLYIDRAYNYVNRKSGQYHQYLEHIANRIYEVIKCTKGKALVLFTSYEALEFTYAQLSMRIKQEIGIQCLKQGMKGSKKVLLDEFVNNVNACLFATGSFWEGIDVKGQSLSCVIIHKLPFPVMDPVLEYKLMKAKEILDEDFRIQLMEMILKLKQGAGRLIRSESDKGILAIMDMRAANKYRDLIISNLPSFKLLKNLDELRQFAVSLEQK